jgi:hypothetical protein
MMSHNCFISYFSVISTSYKDLVLTLFVDKNMKLLCRSLREVLF